MNLRYLKLLLCLFFTESVFSQSNLFTSLKEVPLYWNLDSLEQVLQKGEHSIEEYCNGIICLERSRDILNSVYFGRNLHKLDSLRMITRNDFVSGMYFYFIVRKQTMFRKGDFLTSFNAADSSISKFKRIRDSTGLLNAYCQKAFLEMFLQQSIAKNNVNKGNYNKHDIINSLKLLDSASYLLSANLKDQKYIIYLGTIQKVYFGTTKNADHLKRILLTINKAIENFAGDSIYLIPALCTSYLLLGNVYNYLIKKVNKQISDSAQFYLLKGLQLKRHYGSTYSYSFYGALSNYYILKEDYKNSFIYANLSESIMDSFKVETDYQYLIPYNNKMIAYKKFNDLKNYTTYLEKISSLRETIIINDNSTQYSLGLYQKSLLTQKHENDLVKTKINQQKNILITVLFFLVIVSVLLILIHVNRNTLKKRNKQIQNLLITREKFYTILAHDIRSPMKSYQGMAAKISFLLKKGKIDEIEELSRKIDKTGVHLEGMFQNLVNWSLFQQNSIQPKPETIKPHTLITKLIPVYENLIQEKNLVLNLISNETFTIHHDPNYLSLIIRNLIDNAVKNSAANQAIDIESARQNQQYNFRIRNQAMINENRILAIKQYFRTKHLQHPGEVGMGLGLLLIKEFSEQMGGTVHVSYTDQKLEFILQLPL
jgi:signal transduction histidine kinase